MTNSPMEEGEPNQQWSAMLGQWAIPDAIMAAAPVSPYFFDPTVFTAAADDALARPLDSPSDTAAREALPAEGAVLDIGVGAGAASLRLADRAHHLTGVDTSRELLAAFTLRATQLGVANTGIEGRWPEVASLAVPADVVVCHHVLYNVADLAAFAAALSAFATRRVVVELTAQHPMDWMAPYWKAVHGPTLPDRPTAQDAVGVLSSLGLTVHEHRWRRPVQMVGESGTDQVARVARRLCLGPERHGQVRQLLTTIPPPTERDVATLWWDVDGG
jgi:SAM-dependent methyltransferase